MTDAQREELKEVERRCKRLAELAWPIRSKAGMVMGVMSQALFESGVRELKTACDEYLTAVESLRS